MRKVRRPTRPWTAVTLALAAILLALAATLLALAGYAPEGQAQPMQSWEKQLYDAAKKEKEFTWYTAHYNTDVAAALCKGFEARYPGVKCNFVRTTAQVAYQRLSQDMKAGLAVCSVFSSTDMGHALQTKKDGWVQPYHPHELEAMVPSLKQYNDPDGAYLVTSAGLVLLTYNTQRVQPAQAPKKWTDLLDPRWKNRLSIGHPGFSGYVGTWVVLMRKLYGWDYFEKMEKNKPRIGRSINDTVTMLNAGESDVAAGPDATTLLSQDRGNPVAVVYPEDGTLLMVSPTSIMKNAPAPEAAKLFVEYLLGKDAAEIQVQLRAIAVRKGVKPLKGAKGLDEVKVIRPTVEEIDKGIPQVIEQFRDTFGI